MDEKSSESLVENLITLPTIPTTMAKINALVEDPDATASDIADVVMTDQSVATKVLRIANSTFYGLRTKVNSLTQAVSILGTRTLRNLVLQATTIRAYDHLRGHSEFDIDEFWQESITVGIACQILASHGRKLSSRPEEYYTIGLVRDIGRVVLLDVKTEQFLQAVRLSLANGKSLTSTEMEVFGFDHTHVGEALATRWKLSEEVAYAIRHHHEPPENGDQLKLAACLVAVAEQIAGNLKRVGVESAAVGLDPVALDCIGVPVEETPGVVEEISARAIGIEV